MAETGNEYVKRRMMKRNRKHVSTFKKLQRAMRKAERIEAGDMDGDNTMIEIQNEALYTKYQGVSYVKILHPTKGFQRISSRRERLYGAVKSQMLGVIRHNFKCHKLGKKENMI